MTYTFSHHTPTRVLKHVVGVNASTIRLVLTEPLFNLPALHDTLLQVTQEG